MRALCSRSEESAVGTSGSFSSLYSAGHSIGSCPKRRKFPAVFPPLQCENTRIWQYLRRMFGKRQWTPHNGWNFFAIQRRVARMHSREILPDVAQALLVALERLRLSDDATQMLPVPITLTPEGIRDLSSCRESLNDLSLSDNFLVVVYTCSVARLPVSRDLICLMVSPSCYYDLILLDIFCVSKARGRKVRPFSSQLIGRMTVGVPGRL